MPITGHPSHRTGRAALSGSAAIAGFCPQNPPCSVTAVGSSGIPRKRSNHFPCCAAPLGSPYTRVSAGPYGNTPEGERAIRRPPARGVSPPDAKGSPSTTLRNVERSWGHRNELDARIIDPEIGPLTPGASARIKTIFEHPSTIVTDIAVTFATE